jgi:Rhs element Vgr protein
MGKLLKKIRSKLIDTNVETPSFVVMVDGSDVSKLYSVSTLMTSKSVNKIPYAKLEILDGDASKQGFEASSSGLFNSGAVVELFMGQESTKKSIFKGIIVKHAIQLVGQSTLLVLELKDIAVNLTIGRKNKIFETKNDTEIITQIITDYNSTADKKNQLKVKVGSTKVRHDEMVQYFCTDWDFIVTRAEANGMVVLVDDGEINVVDPLGIESLTSIKDITFGDNVYEFEAETDGREEYKTITASTWDDATRAIITREAEGAVTNNLIKEYKLQHHGQLKGEELQAWAKSKKNRGTLAQIKGRVKIDGDSTLKPGKWLSISKFSKQFNGGAFISSVSHHLSPSSSASTEVEFGFSQDWFSRKYNDVVELPASGLLPSVHGLQTGIVKLITGDPENRYRIKVKLPLVGKGDQGVWARLATLDAGKEHGSFFLPEVGDEVILGFMNDDPREPVILGMLYSSNKNGTPPVVPTDKNYKKGFYTKSKIKFEFDDEKSNVLIETPIGCKILVSGSAKEGDKKKSTIVLSDANGNMIEMNDKGITISSGKDLILSAKGKVTISATEAMVLDTKKTLEIKASTTTKIAANGTMEIKGKLVQIN